MVRARSRDFLLMICGVLLLGIALVTIIVNLVNSVEKISQNERRKQILGNIEVMAEKIAITGKGNFIKVGPKYENLTVSDFNVKFMNKNDKVLYEMKLCNNNLEDVIVEGISMGYMTCRGLDGNERDCSNVKVSKDFYNEQQAILKDSLLKSKACMKANIEVEYVGEDLEEELLTYIKQFSFNIKVVEK